MTPVTIRVVPTLELMATVYRLSKDGGTRSARFLGYVRAAKTGAPISGYNPMTSKPALAAVEALMAMRAEERVERIANQIANELGFLDDTDMNLSVSTPEMWTDRLGTEIHHRFAAKDPRGILWWCDDIPTLELLDAEIAAQTVRMISTIRDGAPTSLRAAVTQEGAARAVSDAVGLYDECAAQALAILESDTSLASKVGCLYGDVAATAMGFTPLGLGERVGFAHAVALARSGALRG